MFRVRYKFIFINIVFLEVRVKIVCVKISFISLCFMFDICSILGKILFKVKNEKEKILKIFKFFLW